MVMYTPKFDNQTLMATTSVLLNLIIGRFVDYTIIYYGWKKIMMANTVSWYLYRLTVNNQYLGITVWTVYCPLLVRFTITLMFED